MQTAFVGTRPVVPFFRKANTSRYALTVKAAKTKMAESKTEIAKKVNLFEAMKFDGQGPELINGRLAMLALPIASTMELVTSKTTLELMFPSPLKFLLLVGVITSASLVPLLRGSKDEKFGVFTPSAEMLNGRAAMIGFASLLVVEKITGSVFF